MELSTPSDDDDFNCSASQYTMDISGDGSNLVVLAPNDLYLFSKAQ